MRRAWVTLALWGVCSAAAVPGAAAAEVALLRVEPEVGADLVRCDLQTQGLPDEKQLQSMRSGLEAAVELQLAVVDESDRPLGGRSLSVRMAFDLWDEVFAVRADGREQRFGTLDDLRAHLRALNGLTVAPADLLVPGGRYRLRVAMVVHAVAPDERRRVEDAIAGERRVRREGRDEQETSVSLGRLIRFFYQGGGDGAADHEIRSDWFGAPGGGR